MILKTFELLKKEANSMDSVVLEDVQLKRLQQFLTNMLGEIIEKFEEKNIQYFLCGGTALGAVRHKGFIPWDDDIDIFMSRENYNRLEKEFTTMFGEKYILCSPNQNSEGLPMPRIRDCNSVVKTVMEVDKEHQGAFCDIFILENTYNNPVLRVLHGIFCDFCGLIASKSNAGYSN